MPTYTLKYTADDDANFEENANDTVSEIYVRYFNAGKITGSTISDPDESGNRTQVISFNSVSSYNEWYAEIDAVDTTPPSNITYVGSGVYAD